VPCRPSATEPADRGHSEAAAGAARPEVDYAIVGAGLSGLMLARALLRVASPRARLLVADPRPRDDGPVTFAYWSRQPGPLEEWTIRDWDTLTIIGRSGVRQQVALGRWRYRAVDWARARADLLERTMADPRVSFVATAVDGVTDGPHSATVRLGGREMSSRWVFDSRPRPLGKATSASGRARPTMTQTFHGVWVSSDRPSIRTDAATLVDFSADDGDDLGFSYVLPVTPSLAMVMAVRMGATSVLPDPQPTVERLFDGADWHVRGRESGATSLAVGRRSRRLGRHVLDVGTRGGRVRPSTGYAVTRIVTDSEAIRRSLTRHDHPFAVPPDPRWQRTLDAIWLRALARERADLEPAFLALFAGAPIDATLRFLDGEATPDDVLTVVRSLPAAPFLRALLPGTGDTTTSRVR
jgi:lycopene beta-cyclase